MEVYPELVGMGMSPTDALAWSIFSPYRTFRTAEAIKRRTKFVHYTSAEVAMSILSEKEVWMRSATTMNDFSEIEYGTGLLIQAFNSDVGKRFRDLIDGLFPDCVNKTAQQFDAWLPRFKVETYITSVSEHLERENELGRLSMWRAYGGATGVALVLNQEPFASTSDALQAYSAPVAYFEQADLNDEFELVVQRIEENRDFLLSLGEEAVSGHVFGLFRTAAVATKHPGFAEELEWRVIHSPTFEPSSRLRHSINTVRGTPQSIYRIPLENVPEEGLSGMTVPEIVDRIIIGPTEHSYAIAEAFARKLAEFGVEEPWNKIKISKIPLRN